jgi:hypothetical protein
MHPLRNSILKPLRRFDQRRMHASAALPVCTGNMRCEPCIRTGGGGSRNFHNSHLSDLPIL